MIIEKLHIYSNIVFFLLIIFISRISSKVLDEQFDTCPKQQVQFEKCSLYHIPDTNPSYEPIFPPDNDKVIIQDTNIDKIHNEDIESSVTIQSNRGYPKIPSYPDDPLIEGYINMYRKPEKSTKSYDSDAYSSDTPFSKYRNLIIVPGHAIYLGNDRDQNMKNLNVSSSNSSIPGSTRSLYFVDDWILESYQISQLNHFKGHIKVGLDLLEQIKDSILLFSGGQTRKDAGPISEASSYYQYSSQNGWFNHTREIRERVFTEEYARDSLENLLFSICRFHEITKYYPYNITVVGFPFKAWRFEQLHRAALYFPKERFTYIRAFVKDPDPTIPTTKNESDQERPNGWENDATFSIRYDTAIEQFQKDQYGCEEPLIRKRIEDRNPFYNANPYTQSCPELRQFFRCS